VTLPSSSQSAAGKENAPPANGAAAAPKKAAAPAKKATTAAAAAPAKKAPTKVSSISNFCESNHGLTFIPDRLPLPRLLPPLLLRRLPHPRRPLLLLRRLRPRRRLLPVRRSEDLDPHDRLAHPAVPHYSQVHCQGTGQEGDCCEEEVERVTRLARFPLFFFASATLFDFCPRTRSLPALSPSLFLPDACTETFAFRSPVPRASRSCIISRGIVRALS
jgi:hypothetical protein